MKNEKIKIIMTVQNGKFFLAALSIFGLTIVSGIAEAKTATVENEISVSSSSGGNVAREGEIVQGETESEVFVETRVNGEVVESYDSRVDESALRAGADLHTQQFNNSFKSVDGAVSVETSVSTTGDADPTVTHPMYNISFATGTNATGTSEAEVAAAGAATSSATTSLDGAGAGEGNPTASAAPRSLLKRAFKFIAYVFSFKWIF